MTKIDIFFVQGPVAPCFMYCGPGLGTTGLEQLKEFAFGAKGNLKQCSCLFFGELAVVQKNSDFPDVL